MPYLPNTTWKRRFSIGTLLLLVLGLPEDARASTPDLLLLTEENPPQNFTDPRTGEIRGIYGDIVGLLLARTGIRAEVRPLPWNRAYAEALARPNTCVFATTMTPARLPLFKWIGPLTEERVFVFSRSDWRDPVASPADLVGTPVMVQENSGVAQLLAELGIEAMPAQLSQMGRMVAKGRADLFAAAESIGRSIASQGGFEARPLLQLASYRAGIACNLRTEDETLSRLNAAAIAAREDGSLDMILARYR